MKRIYREVLAALSITLAVGLLAISTLVAYQARRAADLECARTQVLRDLISTTSNALVIIDPEGCIVEWGPGATRLFGWEEYEVLGSEPDFLMPTDLQERHRRAIAAMAPIRQLRTSLTAVDCYAYTKSGTLIPVHIVVSSFKNHVGYYHVALIVARDEFKQLKEEPKPVKSHPKPPAPRAPQMQRLSLSGN